MFSTSRPVKTGLLEPEAPELPSSSFKLTQQQNLERLIQESQEPPAVDAHALAETSETPRRAKPKGRALSGEMQEFAFGDLVASFKHYSESAPASEASAANDVKRNRRPDSGITIKDLESSIDLLSELAPSEVSVGSPPPAYVRDVQNAVITNGYGVRKHTELLEQAAKNDFSGKLSRALNSTPSRKEEINERVRHNLLQYKALREKLYHVLGDYSYALLQRIRYRLLDLSRDESRISTKIEEELQTIHSQIDALFEVFDIHRGSQKLALEVTAKWKQVEDIDNQEDLEILFKELQETLNTLNVNGEEQCLRKARALLEKRLPISSTHQSTGGSFRQLRKACAKLQKEKARVCSNAVFGSNDTIRAIYETVDEMAKELFAIKTKSARSTKGASTVYQEDSSSHMELLSPQGSTVQSSESSAVQAQEDAKPVVDDAKSPTIRVRRSASTVRAPRYSSSQVRIRQRKNNRLARSIAKWRDGTLTNPIDELYKRLSDDVQSFLNDLGNLDYAGRHQTNTETGINTEKSRKLQRKLTALQKEIRALADSKQNAKLSKLLEPIFKRVGLTWRTIKQALLDNHIVSSKTIVYLHKAFLESQARSTRSIASTSTKQPLARRKRHHSAVSVKEAALIAQREETIDDNDQASKNSKSKEATLQPNEVNDWQRSQVKETLENYGLGVQNSTNVQQFADNESQKLSMCTRSFQGEENDWEDVADSRQSYAPSIASTIKPSTSGKARSEVPMPKVEKRAKRNTEEGEWEDVTSSDGYTPTHAESTVRSVRFRNEEASDIAGNRDCDRHVRTYRRAEHRSRNPVHAPELWGSGVTITKQSQFLFFRRIKQVKMSGAQYEELCEQNRSWMPSARGLRRLPPSA